MSIATSLTALDNQRQSLAQNLTTKGVTASGTETLAQLVPKVLDIEQDGGGGTALAVPLMHLDGINNTGSGHSNAATTWKDLKNKVSDATKASGTALWGEKCLILDGSSYWNVSAPNQSRGTLEVVVSIPVDFSPVNTTAWYSASCIIGRELGGTQQDLGVIIDTNGKFAVGYGNSTIYSSAVSAKDGTPHTISYSYFRGPVKLAIDGVLISDFTTAVAGAEISDLGIGWNKYSSTTKIKGNIFSVKWYGEILTNDQIAENHAENKSYYGF